MAKNTQPWAAALAVGALAWLLPASAGADLLSLPSVAPPPAPASIAPPATACSTPDAHQGSWVPGPHFTGDRYTGTTEWPYLYTVVVDPWVPCLMYRARTPQDLDRSTDGGATWTPILHDVAVNLAATASRSQGMFAMRGITIPSPGEVVIAENGSGDGVLISRDRGTTWQLSNTGIAGQPIGSVTFAPSDPRIAYAARDMESKIGGPFGLYLSRDGGSTWSPLNLPAWVTAENESDTALQLNFQQPGRNQEACTPEQNCPTFPQVQVDPADPAHVYLLVAADQWSGGSAVLESPDAGQVWLPSLLTPAADQAGLPAQFTQLLVTNTPRHGVRLYLTNYVSSDRGSTVNTSTAPLAYMSSGIGTRLAWMPLPVPAMELGRLAADPENGDRLVYLAPRLVLQGLTAKLAVSGYTTSDGFDSARPTTTGVVTTMDLGSSFDHLQPPRSMLVDALTSDAALLIQPDHAGGFTVAAHADCENERNGAPPCFPPGPPTSNAPYSASFQGYIRYAPAAASAVPGAAGGTGLGGGSGNGGTVPGAGGTTAAAEPMTVLRSCSIPGQQLSGTANATFDTGQLAGTSGSLTFDGVNLLYTLTQDTGGPSQGVVRMMDPVTCQTSGAISVQFDPQQLAAVAAAAGQPGLATTPSIDTLAYDANHAELWLSLDPKSQGSRDIVPIFIAHLVSTSNPAAPVAVATFHEFVPRFLGNAGADLLAYDDSDDTVWQAVQGPPQPADPTGLSVGQAGHVSRNGTQIPSCVRSWAPSRLATWVVGAPGRLFVQDEDDVTVSEVDSQTCAVLRVMQHRNFGEPKREDEQMACDGLTFSSARNGATTTALWLRDANTQTVVAYTMPDGACPVPTYTTYLSPHTIAVGASTRFCATVVVHTFEGYNALPAGLPVTFSVGSHVFASAVTVGGPQVCTEPMVEPLPIGTSIVTASFPGNDAYLRSSGTGAVQVLGSPPILTPPLLGFAPVPGPPGGGTAPPPGPATQPAPGTQLQVVEQAQGEAQMQAQGQAQSMVQAQPGMMVQRQKNVQVVTQKQGADTNVAYQASARRRTAPAAPVVAGLLLLGMAGIAARRPRVATARSREFPRRP